MDPRQRRSRDKLHATVLRLATRTPVADLTMTVVAREAGVHRSTMHEHAASPADLLRQALLAELDVLRADLLEDPTRDTTEAMDEVTRRVLEHVRRHAVIYRRGLAADAGDGSLHAMLSEHFLESIRSLDRQRRLGWPGRVRGLTAAQVKDSAARFVAQGTVGAIQGWLEQDPLDVNAFLRLYRTLVPEWWGSRR
jgi:AcrR family transcriptional regulator